MDFVLFGDHGLHAFEVERADRVWDADLDSRRLFREDYGVAKTWLLHTGTAREHYAGVEIAPIADVLPRLDEVLRPQGDDAPR